MRGNKCAEVPWNHTHIPARITQVRLLCCGVNRSIGWFSSGNAKDLRVSPRPFWAGRLSFRAYLFLGKKASVPLS